MYKQIIGYKNTEAITEGFDSGQVFPSAKYNVKVGDLIVVVANDKDNNSIEGYVIENAFDVPNYILRRTFESSRKKGNVKRSLYDGFGGIPIRRFTIENEQYTLDQGGKVRVVDGSQEKIKKYLDGGTYE